MSGGVLIVHPICTPCHLRMLTGLQEGKCSFDDHELGSSSHDSQSRFFSQTGSGFWSFTVRHDDGSTRRLASLVAATLDWPAAPSALFRFSLTGLCRIAMRSRCFREYSRNLGGWSDFCSSIALLCVHQWSKLIWVFSDGDHYSAVIGVVCVSFALRGEFVHDGR